MKYSPLISYRSGQVSGASGVYQLVYAGKAVGEIAITKGKAFPPAPEGTVYHFVWPLATAGTTTSSVLVITQGTRDLEPVLRSLADK